MGSHLFTERLDVLLGRLDPQLAMAVATHILAEEVEAFLDVRDLRLFRREFQSRSSRKLSTGGFTSSFSSSFVSPVMMKSSA